MARSASSKPAAARASPAPPAAHANPKSASKAPKAPKRKDDYSSEGVEDHDILLLPGSDFQIMLGITVLSAAVRLFRIYQPTSVVFDEVQYVAQPPPLSPRRSAGANHGTATASAASPPSTSRAGSSWTCIPRSRSS